MATVDATTAPTTGSPSRVGRVGEVVLDEPGHRLTRFSPRRVTRAPVLLVPPLAVPASVYDFREGHSLVQHLVDRGHPVHLQDHGEVGFGQRRVGMEHFVDGTVPAAVRAAAARDGDVHLLGWSLGGTLSLLTAAADPTLPLRSLTAVATPVDYRAVPLYRPAVLAGRLTGGRFTATLARALGGAPAPLVQAGYRAIGITRELQRPLHPLRHRNDPERLAHERAVDAFLGAMPGYPGRFFLQLWHRIVLGGQLAAGTVEVGGRDVDLARVELPVLAVGSRRDEIASFASVAAITDVLTGARSVDVVEVGGRHLGVLTGMRAPDTTWRHLDTFLDRVEAAAR